MEKEVKTVEEETSYPAEQILSKSQELFGQPRWVVEGALSFAHMMGLEMLKKSEVKISVAKFLAQQDAGHTKGGE